MKHKKLWSILRFKHFLIFATISGFGWVLDIATFTILLFNNIESYTANFISSFVGVTFVWLTSLKTVFNAQKSIFSYGIIIYWLFQFVSIFVYSALIGFLSLKLQTSFLHVSNIQQYGIAAKIIMTPLNLLTNYLFMKNLVKIIGFNKNSKGISIK